ncbi:enoyl-CoA hydratase/isomerase family protein [Embleya scabrispora]|uniref:enoyl-CoA hydratase/isomerase family protein n=1 Tax=Embleya scabrispora TaxID=159449 RepID=UPI00037B37C0|nr:enoyl-CoA hydratase-related protein [Embleya scabrispora]MYS81376.1 enoyl-CoA hydratase/isomerase family protein [Streptomyces sp. SID5474]
MTTTEQELLHRIENGVLWLTLNRPAASNSLTWAQRELLIELLTEASATESVRAVVLTAAGQKHFCTGMDLRSSPGTKSLLAAAETPDDDASPKPPVRPTGYATRMMKTGVQRLTNAVLDCEKPVIAAINGTTAGYGMSLALACDLVIAADSARFIQIFTRRGLVPDGGSAYLLPRLVGPQKAKELMFFGDDLPAAEALRIGVVNKVVAADELEAVTREWAERLATGPTRAYAFTKQLVNHSLESDRVAAFDEEARIVELNMTSRDANEGVASLMERRKPEYYGW